MKRATAIDVLRAAFRFGDDDGSWSARLTETIGDSVPRSGMRVGMLFGAADNGGKVVGTHFTQLDDGASSRAHELMTTLATAPSGCNESAPFLFSRPAAGRLSEHLNRFGHTNQLSLFRQCGVADTHALCAATADGTGYLFVDILEEKPVRKLLLQQPAAIQLAEKLSVAIRVRQQIGTAPLAQSSAVFDIRANKVEHVGEDIQTAGLASAFEAAAVRVGLQSTNAPEKSWVEMLDGRWSVLFAIDSDSRPLVVAVQNPPHLASVAGLSPRQRQIAELFQRGHSQDYIGLELDISPSTVAAHMRTVRHHFAARNDAHLMSILLELASNEDAPTTAVHLTGAEKELVRLVRLGFSDADIARLRGRSVKTIRNQLHRLFRRVNVSSRTELVAALRGTRRWPS